MASKPTVTLTYAGDADKLDRATKRAQQSVTEMGDKVKRESEDVASRTERASGRLSTAVAAGGTAMAAGAAAGVAHLFNLSKSMEALDIKAQTVFQGELPAIQQWAEANRKAFGESTRNVVAMAANLADLLKPMGFTTAQAADMSKKILDLSGALSRWTGGTKTAAEVSEILADAMLGETDGLKALGISISAAEVDAKALSMGLGQTTVDMLKVQDATLKVEKAQRALSDATAKHGSGSLEARNAALALEKAQRSVEEAMAGGTSEISDQARALATQQLILEKSTDAQTAWANGGRAAAEAQNAASSTFAEQAERLATVVTPVFEKLVSVLAAVADWVSRNQEAAIAIGVVTAAVWLLNAALKANPIILIVSLIAGLVAALVVLWTQSETFRNIVTGVFRTVGDVISGVVGFVKGLWSGLVDYFATLPERIGQALGRLGDIISGVFKGALNMGIDAINWGIRRVNDLIHGINFISGAVGIPAIPDIPQIARLHSGISEVPGLPGQEKIAILEAGETVHKRGSGGGGRVELVATGSGWFADMLNAAIADGAIEARFR